jgi:hypothetical protein
MKRLCYCIVCVDVTSQQHSKTKVLPSLGVVGQLSVVVGFFWLGKIYYHTSQVCNFVDSVD